MEKLYIRTARDVQNGHIQKMFDLSTSTAVNNSKFHHYFYTMLVVTPVMFSQ